MVALIRKLQCTKRDNEWLVGGSLRWNYPQYCHWYWSTFCIYYTCL